MRIPEFQGGEPRQMFNFMVQQQNDPYGGRDIADRIMSAEYNQQVQRRDYPQAGRTLAQMFGYWLTRRVG